jgi:hypothetical protein
MRHQFLAAEQRTPSNRFRFGIALLLLLGPVAPSTTAEEAGRLNLFGHHYSVIAGASMFVPNEAEVGASVMRHLVVSARYDAVPKIDMVSLSGFSGRVAVKVF